MKLTDVILDPNLLQCELRDTVHRLMWSRGYNQQELATRANVPKGSLNKALRGSRPFSLSLLDKVTHSFGLLEGELYPLYIAECYRKGVLVPSRCAEFILRCVETGKQELISDITSHMIEHSKKYLKPIFLLAEKLFERGQSAEALLLYNTVIANETNKLSERLSVSYYRRFLIIRQDGLDNAYDASVQLEDTIRYLPAPTQLEAYTELIDYTHLFRKWRRMEVCADKLIALVEDGDVHTFASALVWKITARRNMLDWHNAKQEVERLATVDNPFFRKWAEGQLLHIDIQLGVKEKLPLLCDWVKRYHHDYQDVYHVLPDLGEAYLHHQMFDEVERFFQLFAGEINQLALLDDHPSRSLLFRLLFVKATFRLRVKQEGAGIDDVLAAMRVAGELKNYQHFTQSIKLLQEHAEIMSDTQRYTYSQILDWAIKHTSYAESPITL